LSFILFCFKYEQIRTWGDFFAKSLCQNSNTAHKQKILFASFLSDFFVQHFLTSKFVPGSLCLSTTADFQIAQATAWTALCLTCMIPTLLTIHCTWFQHKLCQVLYWQSLPRLSSEFWLTWFWCHYGSWWHWLFAWPMLGCTRGSWENCTRSQCSLTLTHVLVLIFDLQSSHLLWFTVISNFLGTLLR
jgi:hypothetical protein